MTSLRYLPIFLFFCCSSQLLAQAPQVLQVSPKNMSMAVADDLEIQIDFDQALDLSTVDLSNFKVSGRWTGPRKGLTFSMDNDNKTVKLLLDTDSDPLNAGEWITVYLTKGIRAANGELLAKGYAWNFWIATQPGHLKAMEKIKTIPLRLAGEGLLQSYGAYAGDLDNDGFTDLTVVNETSDDLRILLNDGNGDYLKEDMTVLQMGQATPSPNEGADFNGDGDIDLAVCTAHDNELRVLFGDGEGGFFQQDDYTTGTNARGLVVLDYNGDGAEDIIIANRGSSDMTFFTNDGSGAFTKSTANLDPNGFGESGLAVADVNNDGIQDLFVGNYTSQEITVLLGDGEGGFALNDKVTFLGSNNQPWMVCVGDFNGDGYADAASANSSGNSMTVHFNNGSGGFSSNMFSISVPQGLFPLAIDAGDLDGDGDLDIVTSNYTSVTYAIFENNGLGDFSTSVTILPASDKASCAILHDRDNDGDLDISGTDEGLDHLILFENALPSKVREIPDALSEIRFSPNPFEKEVGIIFDLDEKASVLIEIYDLQGRQIRQIWSGPMPSGNHQLNWDGRDEGGKNVAAGIYWIQWTIEDKVLTRQVVKS